MKRIVAAFGLWIGLAITAQAQDLARDVGLQALQTADDARGWEAVGRLDIDGKGFCTGALIAPDLVLTAAHCLFDRDTGAPVDPSRIEFLAGMRNGRALAYRDVRRAIAHPDYIHTGRVAATATRNDLALLELTQPIRSTQIVAFDTAPDLHTGDQVAVVSYAHDRADAPSLQEVCDVIAEEEGVFVMSCDVDFGSSGAPVFHIDNGQVRIASVVSAKAELDGQRVALGASLAEPLDRLRERLRSGAGIFRDRVPGQVRVITPGERTETGARFVRP